MLFATTNEGKLREARQVGATFGVALHGIDRISRERGMPAPTVSEGESTYEANAIRKARIYSAWSGAPTLADDTGLEICELGGLPGLFTARFGVARVQRLLGHTRPFKAIFVCCVAYAEPGGRNVSVTKQISGSISLAPEPHALTGSLPYSALFTPDGERQTLSELVSSVGYLSHRGSALATLFKVLT